MSAYERRKGKTWERKVARILSDATGLDIRRSADQSRLGSDAPDVLAPGVWLECQAANAKNYNPAAKLAQGEEATDGRSVVAVCKQDRHKPTATMRMRTAAVLWGVVDLGIREAGPVVTLALDDFVRMYALLYGEQQ